MTQAIMHDQTAFVELRLLLSELRKWLTGGYGPLPAGVTLLSKPADFEYAVLKELSDVELVICAKALLGDTRRVTDQIALGHPTETRFINNLTFHSSALSETLSRLEKRG